MYATPLNVSEECLSDRWAYPSNNDLLRSMLINEGVSGSLQSYYELVRAVIFLHAGGFFYAENVFGDYESRNIFFWNGRGKRAFAN